MDVISGLACIAETKMPNPVFLIERTLTFSQTALESIVVKARDKFPEVEFRQFSLDRSDLGKDSEGKWILGSRFAWIKTLKARLDVAVQDAFGVPIGSLNEEVECVHFSFLHDYVRVLLEACRECPRALYPHGFDFPRMQQIRDLPFLFKPRGLLTWLGSLKHMKTTGPGELMISTLYRMFGGRGTCVPYSGTDRVYTFRSSVQNIDTEVVSLRRLKETFQWLTSIPPYSEELAKVRNEGATRSVILLLGEYDRNPIWEENRSWAEAHLELVRATLLHTGANAIAIKAHPRSDGAAAGYLLDYLEAALPETACSRIPEGLSVLPIEALAVGLQFVAACSLGSCSLPRGIGIDVPHFADPKIGEVFDQGWVRSPIGPKYAEIAKTLIDENICQSLGGRSQV